MSSFSKSDVLRSKTFDCTNHDVCFVLRGREGKHSSSHGGISGFKDWATYSLSHIPSYHVSQWIVSVPRRVGNASPKDREIFQGQGFCTPRPERLFKFHLIFTTNMLTFCLLANVYIVFLIFTLGNVSRNTVPSSVFPSTLPWEEEDIISADHIIRYHSCRKWTLQWILTVLKSILPW